MTPVANRMRSQSMSKSAKRICKRHHPWRRAIGVSSAVVVGLLIVGAGPASAAAQLWPPAPLSPHLAVQNTWFTDADVSPYGFRNDVISISGHWFLQEGTRGGDFADFLSQRPEDVERRLRERFLAAHPEVDRYTTATIVIDIERPHPKHLHICGFHECSRSVRHAIVAAYKRRIKAAGNVFPNARLALYGTLNPDELGRIAERTYRARLRALVEAGRDWGLYDGLDYLVPVLYVRFGCDDVKLGPCDPYWGTLDDYTALGIDGSNRLRRSDGSSLPLLPILGFKVYNPASLFDRELLLNLRVPDPVGATLRRQVEILARLEVREFALWTGKDSNQLGGPTDPTLTDHLHALVRPRVRERPKDAS